MTRRTLVFWILVLALAAHATTLGQGRQGPYAAPRTPWGDPDLQGYYTNSDESLIPMERPDALSGRSLAEITPEELARLNEQRNEDRVEADRQRWELRSPLHWFENHNPKNSRHLGAAVDVCDEPDQDDRAALRVRLPRRQLRDAQHPWHRPC